MYHNETMEYPSVNDLNSFQAFIFWFFGVVGVGIYKVLSYIMPKTSAILKAYWKNELTKELRSEISSLRSELQTYRKKKHDSDNEHAILKGAVLYDDKEYLEEYKKRNGKK